MVLRTEVRVPPALGVCACGPMTPQGAGFIPQDGPAAGGGDGECAWLQGRRMVLRTEVCVPPALGVCACGPMTPRGAGFIPQDGPAAGGVIEDAHGFRAAGWSCGLKSAFRPRWACVRAAR